MIYTDKGNPEGHGRETHTRTYAFLDVINMGSALTESIDLLERFWNLTNAWDPGQENKELRYVPLADGESECSPCHRLAVISDSLILFNKKELELDYFYRLAIGLKRFLERHDIRTWLVVNRDWEVSSPLLATRGSPQLPHWVVLTGIGPAWKNLYEAVVAIEGDKAKKRGWHEKYTLFCVDENKPEGYSIQDSITTEGFGGKTIKINALVCP